MNTRIIPSLSILALLASVSLSGCKSGQTATAVSPADQVKLNEQAALEQKHREAEIARWKAAEERARLELRQQAADKKAAELKAKKTTAMETARLKSNLVAITNSGNSDYTNQKINETLSMFASPDAPVLIVQRGINQKQNETTIKKYLTLIRSQKISKDEVNSIKLNAYGKITEVELTKNL